MKEDQLIEVPAMVVNMNPKQDRSWKLVFETRELSGDQVKVLADNYQGEGWLLFKPNSTGILSTELPKGDADSGTKSQTQRQRDVLFIFWKQRGEKGDFDGFYRTELEKYIEFVKSKLIPEEG